MSDGSEMVLAVQIAACIAIAIYAIGLFCAAWIRPELQKVTAFRPRWQYGYRASRLGMTAQAAFALSLSLVMASSLAGIDRRYALWLLLLSGAFNFLMWAIDVSSSEERR